MREEEWRDADIKTKYALIDVLTNIIAQLNAINSSLRMIVSK